MAQLCVDEVIGGNNRYSSGQSSSRGPTGGSAWDLPFFNPSHASLDGSVRRAQGRTVFPCCSHLSAPASQRLPACIAVFVEAVKMPLRLGGAVGSGP